MQEYVNVSMFQQFNVFNDDRKHNVVIKMLAILWLNIFVIAALIEILMIIK